MKGRMRGLARWCPRSPLRLLMAAVLALVALLPATWGLMGVAAWVGGVATEGSALAVVALAVGIVAGLAGVAVVLFVTMALPAVVVWAGWVTVVGGPWKPREAEPRGT